MKNLHLYSQGKMRMKNMHLHSQGKMKNIHFYLQEKLHLTQLNAESL